MSCFTVATGLNAGCGAHAAANKKTALAETRTSIVRMEFPLLDKIEPSPF
jgi:hypothetical protein